LGMRAVTPAVNVASGAGRRLPATCEPGTPGRQEVCVGAAVLAAG
jgi:hypothetical protein